MSTSSSDDSGFGSGSAALQPPGRQKGDQIGNGKLHGPQASRAARDVTRDSQKQAMAGPRDVRDAVPGSSATMSGPARGGTP